MASTKTAEKKAAPKTKAPSGIGIKEVAGAAGVTPHALRKHLRQAGSNGHEARKPYRFTSLTSPAVKKLIAALQPKS